VPFSVEPLIRKNLPVSQLRDAKASSDFADTRFLVPWLCDYKGWAIFVDCDELFTCDPKILWDLQDNSYTVMVRKHNYIPTVDMKFLNQRQYKYGRKNWSSLMLLNCERCKVLTPEYVNNTPGLDLHQFKWTKSIGSLPRGWNHLVGEQEWFGIEPPPLIHYTNGGPYFNEYRDCEFSKEWFQARCEMNYVQQLDES
jgi:hypothetical protein